MQQPRKGSPPGIFSTARPTSVHDGWTRYAGFALQQGLNQCPGATPLGKRSGLEAAAVTNPAFVGQKAIVDPKGKGPSLPSLIRPTKRRIDEEPVRRHENHLETPLDHDAEPTGRNLDNPCRNPRRRVCRTHRHRNGSIKGKTVRLSTIQNRIKPLTKPLPKFLSREKT